MHADGVIIKMNCFIAVVFLRVFVLVVLNKISLIFSHHRRVHRHAHMFCCLLIMGGGGGGENGAIHRCLQGR